VDEFLRDFAENAESFTSDFFFSAGEECYTTIDPSNQASDDLSVFNLEVGKAYSYCVRAIKQGHYMDSPYADSGERRLLTSSEAACEAHTIHWEASIHGQVTTEIDAGSIPIEDVLVSWQLMSKDGTKPLDCMGCSNSTLTNDGGTFNIKFNVNDPSLDNDSDFPVKVTFSKTSPASPEDIKHNMLCNFGMNPCPLDGYITYLSHLQFKAPLQVYDDTVVPVRGKIFIADTAYPGSEGCVIDGAEICLMHNFTFGGQKTLVCVDTERDGSYIAPVAIGATVHSIVILYNGHIFKMSDKNPLMGEEFVTILADEQFINYDYKDITKAELTIEGELTCFVVLPFLPHRFSTLGKKCHSKVTYLHFFCSVGFSFYLMNY